MSAGRCSNKALALVVLVLLAACGSSAEGAADVPATTIAEPTSVPTTTDPTTTTTAPTTTTTTTATTTTTTTTTTEAPPPAECVIEPVPATAGLDPFYEQGCDLGSFWVVSAAVVDPQALLNAAEFTTAIFEYDPELAETLRATDIKMGVIGVDQRTTEMPEYRTLYDVYPDVDWDVRARGLGATFDRPLVSAGEENLLCLPGDVYRGEDILLHEFAHVLHHFGYRVLDPTFDTQLTAAFDAAAAVGTWDNTYAGTNTDEYWAEGVQTYFNRDVGFEVSNGIHGPIDTREELEVEDPGLYALIDERFNGLVLPYACHDDL